MRCEVSSVHDSVHDSAHNQTALLEEQLTKGTTMDTASSIAERRSELGCRIQDTCARVLEDDNAQAKRLEAACDNVLQACADGLPLRHVRSCADVSGVGCVRLAARDLPLRSGPYPLYLRGFERALIDDYTCTGDALLVGAKGAVSLQTGKLLTMEAHGRFSASDQFHLIRPDAGDVSYLRHVLSALDAGRIAKGTNAARIIELADLRSALVPWPHDEVRRLFAETLDLCEHAGAEELRELLISIWMLAAHDVTQLAWADALPTPTLPRLPHEDHSEDALAVAEGLMEVLTSTDEQLIDIVTSTGDLADPASVRRGAVCVCFPAPNQGIWTHLTVDESDPRWLFGPPPRNKANFAWVQHTIACMNEGGSALMLLCNAALHANSGREAVVRRAWARSGLVEAVIALPGGMFADGRPPSSLIVMRKGRAQRDILLINALELGCDLGPNPSGWTARYLDASAITRIVSTFSSWKHGDAYRDIPGLCRSVQPEEIEKHEGVLTPWTYLG